MKELISLVALLLLVGCQANVDAVSLAQDSSLQLQAELFVPDALDEPGTFEMLTEVSQGEEIVTEASQVLVEVWPQSRRDEASYIEAEQNEEGRYVASYDFDEEGLYYVQTHVSAARQHIMPLTILAVGDAARMELAEMDVEQEVEEADHSHSHH